MKRLIFIVCTFAILLGQNIVFPVTADAASIKSLDTGTMVGMTQAALIKKYGNPVRKEPSEYGFTWFVYNRDYANFFMVGVRNAKVVAVYTSAKVMTYRGQFKLNSTKTAVRAKLGKPVSYVQSGNTVCVLNNRDQRDYFVSGSNYIIVFYDNIKGGKATSILIVPQADQDRVLLTHPALAAGVQEAYERISVDLINAARVRGGLKKLATDKLNTKLAESRSLDMRERDYFSHYTPAPENMSPFTQAKKMGIKYSSMGENIAFGDSNAIFAHEAFMNSSGHRNNVLKSVYTKVGAGVASGGSRYVLLTNIFTR